MDGQSAPTPERPRLRPLDIRWMTYQGAEYIVLRDPLGLAPAPLMVHHAVGPLLALMDGSRDEAAIQAAAELRARLLVSSSQLRELITRLDEALLLENAHFHQAQAAALEAYRAAPVRQPALAGSAYPTDRHELTQALLHYRTEGAASIAAQAVPNPDRVVGLLSPHIDYARGGPVYGQVWEAAAGALAEAELIIILGTDHMGAPGSVTLTPKSYATPLGVSPTDADVVDKLARALGPGAFADEIHHRNEHSVELATVWLQHMLRGREIPVVPVLCGSMHHLMQPGADPATEPVLAKALGVLQRATQSKRALVVVAGDLAHVGPAFGDARPLDPQAKQHLASADHKTLADLSRGDAASFFAGIQREGDSRRYCGLTPLYMALRLLGQATGHLTGYAQCPADEQFGSLVSVAGMVFSK